MAGSEMDSCFRMWETVGTHQRTKNSSGVSTHCFFLRYDTISFIQYLAYILHNKLSFTYNRDIERERPQESRTEPLDSRNTQRQRNRTQGEWEHTGSKRKIHQSTTSFTTTTDPRYRLSVQEDCVISPFPHPHPQ